MASIAAAAWLILLLTAELNHATDDIFANLGAGNDLEGDVMALFGSGAHNADNDDDDSSTETIPVLNEILPALIVEASGSGSASAGSDSTDAPPLEVALFPADFDLEQPQVVEPIGKPSSSPSAASGGCVKGPANTDGLDDSPFFTEHHFQEKPCFVHVCYPSETSPFYLWRERYDPNKCCKYKNAYIVLGDILRLNEADVGTECEETVAKCKLPDKPKEPLETIVEVSQTCCMYDGKVIQPEDSLLVTEVCSTLHCERNEHTGGYELSHTIHHNGGQCCQFGNEVVANGWMGSGHICHDGNLYHVTNVEDGHDGGDGIDAAPVESHQTAWDDGLHSFGGLEQPQAPAASPEDKCATAEDARYGSARDFKLMSDAIKDMLAKETISKVFFLLNGNNRNHKYAASSLAADLDLYEERRGYVSYYAFHEDSSCAYYRWDDQCIQDRCQMASLLGTHDDLEKQQKHSSGKDGLAEASELAIHAFESIKKNKQLPLCAKPPTSAPATFHENKDSDNNFLGGLDGLEVLTARHLESMLGIDEQQADHTDHGKPGGKHDNLVIFFVASDEDKFDLDEAVAKHARSGCKVAFVTFNLWHWTSVKNVATPGPSGSPLAFNLETSGLQAFFLRRIKCHCGLEPGDLSIPEDAIETRPRHGVEASPTDITPSFIDNCVVTLFMKRHNGHHHIKIRNNEKVESKDVSCDMFKTAMAMMGSMGEERSASASEAVGIDKNSQTLTGLLGSYSGEPATTTKRPRHLGDHDGVVDKLTLIKHCMSSINGNSLTDLFWCIRHVASKLKNRDRRSVDVDDVIVQPIYESTTASTTTTTNTTAAFTSSTGSPGSTSLQREYNPYVVLA